MWSTGTLKKPWIWPAWRSIETTRSTPATSSMSATSFAVIGSPRARLLSLPRDGLARSRLLVLPRVREPRDDRGHALRRGEARSLDHHEQLDEVVVHRR